MKKLLFSVIALVAFSGVSVANTVELENLTIKDVKIEKTTFLRSIYLSPCSIIYLQTLQTSTEFFSDEDAADIALAAYQVCVEKELK